MQLYTKTVCPKCLWVKSELQRAGKDVDVINVDHDEVARDRLIAAGLMRLPVLEIDGRFVSGAEEILEKTGCRKP